MFVVYKKKCKRCEDYFDVGPGNNYAARQLCQKHTKWKTKKRK